MNSLLDEAAVFTSNFMFAHFRYNGVAGPCPGGGYDDVDDLAFHVKSSVDSPTTTTTTSATKATTTQQATTTQLVATTNVSLAVVCLFFHQSRDSFDKTYLIAIPQHFDVDCSASALAIANAFPYSKREYLLDLSLLVVLSE